MMRRALALALFLLAPTLAASVTTTAVRGRVTSSGMPAAGVTVTASSPALQHPRTTLTGARGTYWLAGLPPGRYDVTFSRAGLQTLTRRVEIRLAHVARADAVLEPSEDEESVTATAKTVSVADTLAITTHRTAEELERFPVYPDAAAVAYAAPPPLFTTPAIETDDYPWGGRSAAETVDEVTLIHAARPLDIARGGGSTIRVATRSGGELLSMALRDTLSNLAWVAGRLPRRFESNDTRHVIEIAAGGRIARDRLWFFGAAWRGDRADVLETDLRGAELKLTARIGESQVLVAEHLDAERTVFRQRRATATFVRHVGQWGPRLLTEVMAGRSADAIGGAGAQTSPAGTARATFVAGAHVISGGVEWARKEGEHLRYVFASERWMVQRWTVVAALAHRGGDIDRDDSRGWPYARRSELSAQMAAAYDLTGDGRRAVLASASRYSDLGGGDTDEATLSVASAIGASGTARIDAIRREQGQLESNAVRLDGSYRLFDRIGIGANYTWAERQASHLPRHVGNAWVTAELPVGSHAVAATVVQRYGSGIHRVNFSTREGFASTDAALRYRLPIGRTALTLGADAENLFDRHESPSDRRRTLRLWFALRFQQAL